MIYIKTAVGRQALKDRSDTMPRKYHFPFLMFDGTRDHTDVLSAEAKTGFTAEDIDQMVQLGFIAPLQKKEVSSNSHTEAAKTATSLSSSALPTEQQAILFVEAVHRATSMTAHLGLRGFRLNLAIERASNLNELRALLPQIESAVGAEAIKPLLDVLGSK